MHGVGTEKDVSEANAAEAAAEKMDLAFGQPVGTTTFNTPPLGSGEFEPPRSATGTPAESLLAAVKPQENANPYTQGQMPQPMGSQSIGPNDFQKIADKYTHAAEQGVLGMQGYNAGTYANQMPQPTNVATTIGANDYSNQMPQPTGVTNPYAQGQMPQPIGPSNANVRTVRDAITQNVGSAGAGNGAPTGFTAPAGNIPTPPIPLRDLQGPSIAEGIAGAFGLSTQQQFDKFYKGYIDQGHNETDAYNKAIGDIQTMRANAKPGSFDRSGKTQKIQQLMPDGTYQLVDAPYKRGGGVHSSQIVDHVLTKFGASLPASSNPYYGNMAGRRR
jgi:hypothetical protein